MKTTKLLTLALTLVCFIATAEAQSLETLKRKVKSQAKQEVTKQN